MPLAPTTVQGSKTHIGSPRTSRRRQVEELCKAATAEVGEDKAIRIANYLCPGGLQSRVTPPGYAPGLRRRVARQQGGGGGGGW